MQHKAPTYGFQNEIPIEMQLSFLSGITLFTIAQCYMKMIVLLVILNRILKSSINISVPYEGKKGDCVIMSFNHKTPFILNEDCVAALN